MLKTQANPMMIPSPLPALVQTGPAYICPVCGQPALGLMPWPVNPANPCRLDEWAVHIWYLRRNCGCRIGGRVARLGDYITPLEFTYDRSLAYEQRVHANVAALCAALNLLAEAVPTCATWQIHQIRQPGLGGGHDHTT